MNSNDWQAYTSPIIIQEEGTTLVDYRSIDNVGNIEETKSLEVQITKLTFENLFKLMDEAKIHHGQKNALKAHIKSAEKGKDS